MTVRDHVVGPWVVLAGSYLSFVDALLGGVVMGVGLTLSMQSFIAWRREERARKAAKESAWSSSRPTRAC